MKTPLILVACLLLAGCTDADWNQALNYGGLGEADSAEAEMAVETKAPGTPAQMAPQPVAANPAASAGADFCKSVATQDATTNGFDPATQQRVLQQSYQQCITIYSR